MKKIIIANYKMNPQTEREAVKLAHAEDREGVIIAPPFPFLIPVKKALKKAMLGAQDVSTVSPLAGGWGAYTGAVSASMLKKMGVQYVIVGHSERRGFFNETDVMIAKKIVIALEAKLKVILCVGENADVRAQGITPAKAFVAEQLQKDFSEIINNKSAFKNIIVAYEPIWAISTTLYRKDVTLEDAETMAEYIKEQYPVRVLYGGSVNARNASGLLAQKNIDGLLVGGMSLKLKEFKKIISNF